MHGKAPAPLADLRRIKLEPRRHPLVLLAFGAGHSIRAAATGLRRNATNRA
jgi:hypothetical protein